MTKVVAVFLAFSVLMLGCRPLENTITLTNTKPPVVRNDITFMYSSDQIRYDENNIRRGWANRNNIQVLNVKIINNTNHSIHGSQFEFYSNGERLKIVNNRLASKKLKSRKFPSAVYIIPGVIVAVVIYAGFMSLVGGPSDLDGDGFDDDIDSGIKESDKKQDPLHGLNHIQRELYLFNIAEKIVPPNRQVSGLIAFRAPKGIDNLNIQIEKSDFEVIGEE